MSRPTVDKHVHYNDQHVPDEEFWGVGLENETYIEIVGGLEIPAQFLLDNTVRERYSVNYWLQYKPGAWQRAVQSWIDHLPNGGATRIRIPLLMNGHSIAKCDPAGQHRTVLDPSGVAVPNPAFGGTTLLEYLATQHPVVFGIDKNRAPWWCFDGDTVEFMTQAFRCAKYEDVIDELCRHKRTWIAALRAGLKSAPSLEPVLRYGDIRWPKANYGLAAFLTNRTNVAIFNNGTYHVNITAPTRLDKNGDIADWPAFEEMHRRAARLFQWISPFLVAAYGSADPMANLADPRFAGRFPAGSQRSAASRYIGVGTYDTRLMPRGKILTTPIKDMDPAPAWWIDMHRRYGSDYNMLEMMGYDINFNKYKNHGLEFRIFDWFPENRLDGLMRLLIAMFDRGAEATEAAPFPQESAVWREVVGRCVWHGASAHLRAEEAAEFARVLGVPDIGAGPVLEAFDLLQKTWVRGGGLCVEKMFGIPPPLAVPQLPPLKIRIPYIERMNDELQPVRGRRTDIIRVSLFRELSWKTRVSRDPVAAATVSYGIDSRLDSRLAHIRSLLHGDDRQHNAFYNHASSQESRREDSQALLAAEVPLVDQRCLPKLFSRPRTK